MNYIGKKGYTIPKSSLSQRELIDLKNDLWLKPQINGKQFAAQNQIPSFPVYRENDKKNIYIPRFYGIEKYGLPEKSELDEGINIDVEFTKELRDYQKKGTKRK